MIPTTALLTEFLVVGSMAWLWLLPILAATYRFSISDVMHYLATAPTPHQLLLVFATYVMGVFTESLSFAIEKIFVGPTSSPRRWYSSKIAKMSSRDWHAAQDRMWSSETAFKEFKQTHLRSNISRGVFFNACVAALALSTLALSRHWEKDFGCILVIAICLAIISPISWWFAQIEHTARVRVAGEIAEEHKES